MYFQKMQFLGVFRPFLQRSFAWPTVGWLGAIPRRIIPVKKSALPTYKLQRSIHFHGREFDFVFKYIDDEFLSD